MPKQAHSHLSEHTLTFNRSALDDFMKQGWFRSGSNTEVSPLKPSRAPRRSEPELQFINRDLTLVIKRL